MPLGGAEKGSDPALVLELMWPAVPPAPTLHRANDDAGPDERGVGRLRPAQASSDTSPSRMAYFVSSATPSTPSFFMIRRL